MIERSGTPLARILLGFMENILKQHEFNQFGFLNIVIFEEFLFNASPGAPRNRYAEGGTIKCSPFFHISSSPCPPSSYAPTRMLSRYRKQAQSTQTDGRTFLPIEFQKPDGCQKHTSPNMCTPRFNLLRTQDSYSAYNYLYIYTWTSKSGPDTFVSGQRYQPWSESDSPQSYRAVLAIVPTRISTHSLRAGTYYLFSIALLY